MVDYNKDKIAFKFLQLVDNEIVSDYDQSEWEYRVWREVPTPIYKCVGLNCSVYAIDAYTYVNGPILALVEYDGEIVKSIDKITCQKMRILSTIGRKEYLDIVKPEQIKFNEKTNESYKKYIHEESLAWYEYDEESTPLFVICSGKNVTDDDLSKLKQIEASAQQKYDDRVLPLKKEYNDIFFPALSEYKTTVNNKLLEIMLVEL